MQFLKVPIEKAQAVRERLKTEKLLNTQTKVERDDSFIYFPVQKAISGYDLVERKASAFRTPQDLRSLLRGHLTEAEQSELIASYDLVGNIAIIEVPDSLQRKEKIIAQALLETHQHVTTVLKRGHKHEGEFRTQGLVHLAGEDTREALVRESGLSLLIDVEQVYFSIRLSTERLRLAALVRPHERVLVLFSGAAPYVCVFAKHSLASLVVGVEKNPAGHRYALENVRRNKLKHVQLYNADCVDLSFLEKVPGYVPFDRIVLMLPSGAKDFVREAVRVAAPGCVLHVYGFAREDEVSAMTEYILHRCTDAGRQASFIQALKAGHHKPHVYRYCFDIRINA